MRILSVNGGNGVFVHPLRKHLIANVEYRSLFKTPGDIQWKLNFGDIPLYNNTKIPISWKIFGEVDVVIGAPDCGPSSKMSYSRTKKLTDPSDNDSFMLYVDSIIAIRPKIFVMENLPASLDSFTKNMWEGRLPGYTLIYHELSVSEFGNSQKNRVRLVMVGVREDVVDSTFLRMVHKVEELMPCRELLEGLPKLNSEEGKEVCHVNEDVSGTGKEVITLYAGFKASLAEIKETWLSENWSRWQVKDRNFNTAPGVYRNRDHDFPNTARKSNRQFNELGDMMSPRELARIQGVPDRFQLWYDESKHGYCINKARTTVAKTPPYEIGLWLKKQLKMMNKYGQI